jgi:hypothetical protein
MKIYSIAIAGQSIEKPQVIKVHTSYCEVNNEEEAYGIAYKQSKCLLPEWEFFNTKITVLLLPKTLFETRI